MKTFIIHLKNDIKWQSDKIRLCSQLWKPTASSFFAVIFLTINHLLLSSNNDYPISELINCNYNFIHIFIFPKNIVKIHQ